MKILSRNSGSRRTLRSLVCFGALALVVSGCTSSGEGGGGTDVTQVAGLKSLTPWVATFSTRSGRETRVVDMGNGRILGRVNFADEGSDCQPHHFTPMQTKNPTKDGFIGLQTCRGTSEVYILKYTPTDPAKPMVGGTLAIDEALTKKYGIIGNHATILKPDKSMWAVNDDQYDTTFFVSAKEEDSYKAIKGYEFDFDKKTGVIAPKELKPGSNGKFDVKAPGGKFGPARNEFGTWLANGKYWVQGHRGLGAMTVFDGETLEPVAGYNVNTGDLLEQVDPNDAAKGFVIPKENLENEVYLHGAGVTNDSKFLLINDLTGNTTNVFDLSNPDPTKWSLHKEIEWPGTEAGGVNPYHMNFSPDGKTAFVALRAYDTYKEGTGATAVVSLPDFKIKKIIEVPGFVEPHGLAATPDGKYMVQAFAGWDSSGGGHVVYDMKTLKPAFNLPTGVAAHEFVIVQQSKITNGC